MSLMPSTYKFEIRVRRDETNRYLEDSVDSYVETIEVASIDEAIDRLKRYRLVVVPAAQQS